MNKLAFFIISCCVFTGCLDESNTYLIEPVFFECINKDSLQSKNYSALPLRCGNILLDEQFSDNSKPPHFSLSSNTDSKYKIVSGRFTMELTNKFSYTYNDILPLDKGDVFQMEFDFIGSQGTANSPLGFTFWANDWHFYYCGIDHNKNLIIGLNLTQTSPQTILYNKKINIDLTKINKFALRVVNKELFIFVNDTFIDTFTITQPKPGNNVGMRYPRPYNGSIDNVFITEWIL